MPLFTPSHYEKKKLTCSVTHLLAAVSIVLYTNTGAPHAFAWRGALRDPHRWLPLKHRTYLTGCECVNTNYTNKYVARGMKENFQHQNMTTTTTTMIVKGLDMARYVGMLCYHLHMQHKSTIKNRLKKYFNVVVLSRWGTCSAEELWTKC